MSMTLFPIGRDGSVAESQVLSAHAEGVLEATIANYNKTGYQPPWTGYLSFDGDLNIGTCGFTGPPVNNHVELAYYMFPEFEGRGYASAACLKLIDIARAAQPDIIVTAHTLPVEGPSPRILRKAGFVNQGSVIHREDGEVWYWVLTAPQHVA